MRSAGCFGKAQKSDGGEIPSAQYQGAEIKTFDPNFVKNWICGDADIDVTPLRPNFSV